MRFYEFELIKHKQPGEIADKGISAAKSAAGASKSALGSLGRGVARGVGMFFKDFDPAMQMLYKDGDLEQQKKPAGAEDRKRLKNALGKVLNNEPIDDNDRRDLKLGLNREWFKDMEDPDFKSGIQKIIAKQTPQGQELVMLKRVHAKMF
jgi:hypothetical protein